MNKLYFFFVILIVSASALAQEKTAVAVMDLNGEGISPSETKLISSRLRMELFRTGKFTVVEREKMFDILEEQGFQASGCTSNECAVEVGRLLGVSTIIAGDVGKIGELYTVSVRMIDVETGKLLKFSSSDCDCKIETFLTETISEVAAKLVGTPGKFVAHAQRALYVTPWFGFGGNDYDDDFVYGMSADLQTQAGRFALQGLYTETFYAFMLQYKYPLHIYKDLYFLPEAGAGYVYTEYYSEDDENFSTEGFGFDAGFELELSIKEKYKAAFSFEYYDNIDYNFINLLFGFGYKF